jgi:hypothetical protein
LIYLGPDEPQGSVLQDTDQVKIYPNPLKAGQSLKIKMDIHHHSDCLVAIYDLKGRKIYQNFFSGTQGQMILDDLHLEESIYILEIQSDRSKIMSKLVCVPA